MAKISSTDLDVYPIALGGNVFGWTADEAESFAVLDGYAAAGGNFIDTADVYSAWAPGNSGGESETILGRWIASRGSREQTIIATKVGIEMAPGKKGLSKTHILRSIDESLKRLQTDYVDLYQSHKDDPDTPLEETLSAFAELIKQGKVIAIGASNYSSERLAKALEVSEQLGVPRYESLQPQYNLYDREEYEEKLEPLCVDKGIGVINYYSLASGFLTGKYRSEADLGKSPRGEGIKKYLNDRGFRILKALDEVAKKHDSTPARVALAWLIARPSITAPIASATSLEQLNDLIEATELTLDHSSIELLNQASAYKATAGRL